MTRKPSLPTLRKSAHRSRIVRSDPTPASGPNALPLGRCRAKLRRQLNNHLARPTLPRFSSHSRDDSTGYESLVDILGLQFATTRLHEDTMPTPPHHPNATRSPSWAVRTCDSTSTSDTDIEMSDFHEPATPMHRERELHNTRRRRASEPIYPDHSIAFERSHIEATPSLRLSKRMCSTSSLAQDANGRFDHAARRQRKMLRRKLVIGAIEGERFVQSRCGDGHEMLYGGGRRNAVWL